MRKTYPEFSLDFKTYWKNYVFQSLAAAATVFVLLLLVSIQKKPVIIASVAATTFIVFAMPGYITARAGNIIGGHVIGMLCGFVIPAIPLHYLMSPRVSVSLLFALAVGVSIFIMVITDTEHPPAAGTALGVAIAGFSVKITVTILVCVTILGAVHYFFRDKLRDLTG